MLIIIRWQNLLLLPLVNSWFSDETVLVFRYGLILWVIICQSHKKSLWSHSYNNSPWGGWLLLNTLPVRNIAGLTSVINLLKATQQQNYFISTLPLCLLSRGRPHPWEVCRKYGSCVGSKFKLQWQKKLRLWPISISLTFDAQNSKWNWYITTGIIVHGWETIINLQRVELNVAFGGEKGRVADKEADMTTKRFLCWSKILKELDKKCVSHHIWRRGINQKDPCLFG